MPATPTVPRHLGVIMDGNGRWAKARGLPRTEGHRRGLETAKAVVREAELLGVEYLSLYVFSTENWKRSAEEVGFLMGLITRHLSAELDFYRENGVRIVHTGARDGLPAGVLAELDQVMADTADYEGIVLNMAINHGGRDEIVRAARSLAASGAEITEEAISGALDAPTLPDLDAVIRTGGERRLSNFLLWRSAYAELHFTDTLWPDFTVGEFRDAVRELSRRERRFGDAK